MGKGSGKGSGKGREGGAVASIARDGNCMPDLPKSLAAASHKMRTDEEICIITVNGKTYDLTKWAPEHPGGALIRQYHGRDATAVFNAMHGEDAKARLAKMKPLAENSEKMKEFLPQEACQRSVDILDDFAAFKRQLIDEGYFTCNPFWQVYKFVSTMSWIFVALYFQYHQYYFISSLFCALYWQQLGWLGHDFCHHSIFENRELNHFFAWVTGNVAQGYSGHWWKDRHNSHHAVTNIVDADPDIDNIPMLAWAPSDLDKADPLVRKYLIPYQDKYFLFILPILRLTWLFGSLKFVSNMKNSPYSQYRKDFWKEAIGLGIHWTWVTVMLAMLPSWKWRIAYFLISECLAGFGTGIVVFFNHYSCDKYDTALAGNFVCLQLFTTRNMTPGVWTDWICGGLNYQIEHHLFPTIPRHNLYKCSLRVREWVKKHQLPYLSSDFLDGTDCVLDYLRSMSKICKEKYPNGYPVQQKKTQ
eukprot:g67822.t1